MFKFYDVEQNTDAWWELRGGKLTSSNLGKVMANFGKAFGEPAIKMAVQIAIQQITGKASESGGFSNEHTERGHEQEPLARFDYESEFFCDVTNGGFFGSDFIGCSPDGLVGDKGVIEIKSVISSVHYANVKRAKVDPAYKWQCIGNVKFTDRDWLDFISYCADYPEGKRLFTYRIYADKLSDEFAMIDERIEEFKELVDSTKERILTSDYTILTA